MKVNILGDSHTRALWIARKKWTGDALSPMAIKTLGAFHFFFDPFFVADEEGIGFVNAKMQARFRKAFGRDRIGAPDGERGGEVWAFLLGFHSARFFREAMWRRFAPVGAGGPDHQVLSAAVIRRMVEADLVDILAFLDAVAATSARFLVVSAPPPPNYHPNLRHPVTRPVAIAVNAAYRRAVADILDARGIGYVLPDPATADEDGLLLPEYANGNPRDRHHANGRYGATMLPRIADAARAMANRDEPGEPVIPRNAN